MFTPPLRKLTRSTSRGFAVIDFAREVLGIELFPWQKWLLVHALELLPDGSPRFRTVVVLVARQNGKSTLSQVLALYWLYVMRCRMVVGTAQTLDLAEEVWADAVDLAEAVDELAELVADVNRTNGRKALKLVDGERYKVQAASRKGGRGLTGDLILLDELREHQTWQAWAAVTKTTMARPEAMVWALSNAGDITSVVLRHLRLQAHKSVGDPDGINSDGLGGELLDDDALEAAKAAGVPEEALGAGVDALGLFEWSAAPGCDKWDRVEWAHANPSLGWGSITERAIAAACATDPEVEVFRPEVLCQWNEGSNDGPFPPGAWAASEDPRSSIPDGADVVYGVDTEHDRSRSFISVSGYRADGAVHVEVVAARAGVEWVKGWFADRAKPPDEDGPGRPYRVALQERGAPVSSIKADLEAIPGVEVIEWSGSALGEWTGAFYDGVTAHLWTPGEGETEADRPRRVWHLPQPVLTVPAATAVPKPLADSWVWNRKASPYGCAAMVSATAAVGALLLGPVEDVPWSTYEDEDAEVVFV